MAKYTRNNSVNGQTIIEVVVISGMIIVVMVALVSGVVRAMATNRGSNNRALAIRMAQESIEWLRSWKDEIGWQPAVDSLEITGTGALYCMNELPLTEEDYMNLSAGDCGPNEFLGETFFQRKLELTLNGESIEVDSIVTWFEKDQSEEVRLSGKVTKWRK